jgi:hypothetical protein
MSKDKISDKSLEKIIKELLEVLSKKNLYGTFSQLPIFIDIIENQTSDKGSGYSHIITIKLISTYLGKEKIDYLERIGGHTDEKEVLAEDYSNYIKKQLDKKYKDTVTEERHFFIKEQIKGSYRIKIIRKDGS